MRLMTHSHAKVVAKILVCSSSVAGPKLGRAEVTRLQSDTRKLQGQDR